MTENKNQDGVVLDRIARVGTFFWTAAKEIAQGIARDRIPAHKYCYVGVVLALALIARVDESVVKVFRPHYNLSHHLRHALVYLSLVSGWLVWGIVRAMQRNQLLTQLRDTFEAAKLKCNGRYPSLIEDVEVDECLRRIRLRTNGVTKSEFEAATERFATMLNISVSRILQEDGDKSRVDILYTTRDLNPHPVLENSDRLVDAEIPIGETYEGKLAVNLREVGHILVAGQTGGGKSNFLKVVTSILARNNSESPVYFLDFKGGMESADLKNEIGNLQNNITYFDGTKQCVQELVRMGTLLDLRLKDLASQGASTLDDYLKSKRTSTPSTYEGRKDINIQRTFIIIDELAQLASKDPGIDSDLVKQGRAALNRIARQGRAAGVHLIVATQKPDSSSFDQTVKANLPGVLCFPMSTQAASVSAVGSKRAFELNPDLKGRAIWKFGPRIREVQTYKFN